RQPGLIHGRRAACAGPWALVTCAGTRGSVRLTTGACAGSEVYTRCAESPPSTVAEPGVRSRGTSHFALVGLAVNNPVALELTLPRGKKMDRLVKLLARSPLLTPDLDHYLIRAAMVIIFVLFGYQKWFEYEARVLIPYISHGPFVFWLYPVFGIRGASWFLGVV